MSIEYLESNQFSKTSSQGWNTKGQTSVENLKRKQGSFSKGRNEERKRNLSMQTHLPQINTKTPKNDITPHMSNRVLQKCPSTNKASLKPVTGSKCCQLIFRPPVAKIGEIKIYKKYD